MTLCKSVLQSTLVFNRQSGSEGGLMESCRVEMTDIRMVTDKEVDGEPVSKNHILPFLPSVALPFIGIVVILVLIALFLVAVLCLSKYRMLPSHTSSWKDPVQSFPGKDIQIITEDLEKNAVTFEQHKEANDQDDIDCASLAGSTATPTSDHVDVELMSVGSGEK